MSHGRVWLLPYLTTTFVLTFLIYYVVVYRRPTLGLVIPSTYYEYPWSLDAICICQVVVLLTIISAVRLAMLSPLSGDSSVRALTVYSFTPGRSNINIAKCVYYPLAIYLQYIRSTNSWQGIYLTPALESCGVRSSSCTEWKSDSISASSGLVPSPPTEVFV